MRFEIEIIESESSGPGSKEKKRKGWKYTLYGPDIAYTMTELGEKGKVKTPIDDSVYLVELKQKDTDKIIVYKLEIFDEVNSKVTPAIRIGYIQDPDTGWETFVSPLHSARHLFQDMMNTKGEYDLHKALHGFLQKFAFAEKCDFQAIMEDGLRDMCNGGTLQNGGGKCPSCKGSGIKMHTTVQDIVLIQMPESKEEHIQLKDMVHYVEIPEHVHTNLKEELKDLQREVSEAIFNTNTFDRSEIAMTATEKRLNLQSLYNVLTEFGIQVSEIYKFLVYQSARYMDIDEGLAVQYQITKDFHLESLEELLSQLKSADTAPYAIKQAIEFSIMAKQNQDDSVYVDQIRAQERFRPFKDKSKSEVIMIISQLPAQHPSKLLWMYFDEVFERIWNDPALALFHKWKYSVQKIVVDKILEELAARDAELMKETTFREALDE